MAPVLVMAEVLKSNTSSAIEDWGSASLPKLGLAAQARPLRQAPGLAVVGGHGGVPRGPRVRPLPGGAQARPRPEPRARGLLVEALVGRERRSEKENDFPWKWLDPGKKLLLCSMGSQSYLVGREKIRRLYTAVAEVAAREWDWQPLECT